MVSRQLVYNILVYTDAGGDSLAGRIDFQAGDPTSLGTRINSS